MPACLHPFGLQPEGQPLRVACLETARLSADRVLAAFEQPACGQQLFLHSGELLFADGCSLRIGSLPASARLTLGLSLDLNKASASDLQELPRVGPVMARRILKERERRGWFSNLEQLRAVRGIGPVTLEWLRRWLIIKPELGSKLRRPSFNGQTATD